MADRNRSYSSFDQLPPELQQAVVAQMGARSQRDLPNAQAVLRNDPVLAQRLMRMQGIGPASPTGDDSGIMDQRWMDHAIAQAGGPASTSVGPPAPAKRASAPAGSSTGAGGGRSSGTSRAATPATRRSRGPTDEAGMDIPPLARRTPEGSAGVKAANAKAAKSKDPYMKNADTYEDPSGAKATEAPATKPSDTKADAVSSAPTNNKPYGTPIMDAVRPAVDSAMDWAFGPKTSAGAPPESVEGIEQFGGLKPKEPDRGIISAIKGRIEAGSKGINDRTAAIRNAPAQQTAASPTTQTDASGTRMRMPGIAAAPPIPNVQSPITPPTGDQLRDRALGNVAPQYERPGMQAAMVQEVLRRTGVPAEQRGVVERAEPSMSIRNLRYTDTGQAPVYNEDGSLVNDNPAGGTQPVPAAPETSEAAPINRADLMNVLRNSGNVRAGVPADPELGTADPQPYPAQVPPAPPSSVTTQMEPQPTPVAPPDYMTPRSIATLFGDLIRGGQGVQPGMSKSLDAIKQNANLGGGRVAQPPPQGDRVALQARLAAMAPEEGQNRLAASPTPQSPETQALQERAMVGYNQPAPNDSFRAMILQSLQNEAQARQQQLAQRQQAVRGSYGKQIQDIRNRGKRGRGQ